MGRNDDQVRITFSDLENAVSLISRDLSVQTEIGHLVSRTRSDWLSFASAEHFWEPAESLNEDLSWNSRYEDVPVRSIVDRHGEIAYRIANEMIVPLVNAIESALETDSVTDSTALRCFRLARHIDEWARPRTIFRETVGLEHLYQEFVPATANRNETGGAEPTDATSAPPAEWWITSETPPGPPLRVQLRVQYVISTADTIEERQLDRACRECVSAGVDNTLLVALAEGIPRLPAGRIAAAAAADAIHEGVLQHFASVEHRSATPLEHSFIVDVDRRTAYLNGTPILVDTEQQVRVLRLLSEHPGRFYSSSEIVAEFEDSGPIGPRIDRLLCNLPDAINQLIDRRPGRDGGFRLNLTQSHNLRQ
jgi:hypothetical protein